MVSQNSDSQAAPVPKPLLVTRTMQVPPDCAWTRNSAVSGLSASGSLPHEGGPVLLVDEAARRFPCGDLAVGAHLRAHGEVQGAAFALFHLRRREPGAHALRGGDGLPDLLRAARDLDAELQAVRDVRGGAHGFSSGRGWAATRSRCGRPSSWW